MIRKVATFILYIYYKKCKLNGKDSIIETGENHIMRRKYKRDRALNDICVLICLKDLFKKELSRYKLKK